MNCRAVAILAFGLHVCSAQIVNFNNNVTFLTPGDRLVLDSAANLLVGTNYLAQLYYGIDTDSLRAVTAAPATFKSATSAPPHGVWLGDNRTLVGFMPLDTVTLQVHVWDVAAGSSWEEAAQTGFGVSQYGVSMPFLYTIPNAFPPGAGFIENFRGFSLVPEPTTAFAAIIGILLLFLTRRGR